MTQRQKNNYLFQHSRHTGNEEYTLQSFKSQLKTYYFWH